MSHEADRAASHLRELDAVTGRTRLASRSMATGFPMVGWGVAWIVGLGALDLLSGPLRVAVPLLAWTFGMVLSWVPMRAVIRTGTEGRMRLAWVVVLVASPFLVVAAQPASFAHAMLLAGALWGLAMCLYAVATDDRALAVVAGFGIVLAAALSPADQLDRLLWFGIGAGVPILALGISRVLRGVGRV